MPLKDLQSPSWIGLLPTLFQFRVSYILSHSLKNWYFCAHTSEYMPFSLPKMLFLPSEMPMVDLQAQHVALPTQLKYHLETDFIASSPSPSHNTHSF